MATMEEVRKQYPQYNDMSDEALAKALHQKFYSDMPFEDFAARVGVANQPDAPLSWAEVPGKALENTPASAYRFAEAMAYPIMHPIQTAQAMGDLGAGALRAGAQAVLPESAFNYLDSIGGQENSQRAAQTATGVKDLYLDRYGSVDGLKRTLAEDPIGALADASTVLTGGATGAKTLLGQSSKIARGLDTAARVTNPLTVPIKAAQLTAKAVGAGTKAVGAGTKGLLGLTTGTSSDTIGEAYQAGKAGGKQKKAFTRNLRGDEEQAAVIGEARDAVGQIAEKRAGQYQKDMAAIKADKTPIDFQPIEQKFFDIVDSMYESGHQVAADETIGKLNKIQDVLAEWSADPSMHTAGGLDALKKRIDNLMPSFNDANAGNTERAVTAIRNAVKDEVVNAAPQYADAMKGYESSKAVQREIEQSLSLGRKASADTTLRKLQSVTRNNANTNYGGRMSSAELLKEAGAETLMPRLAGQAMQPIVPRGVMGALTGAGLLGGAWLNPALLAGLPLASPRLVGEGAQMLGTMSRYAKKIPKPSRQQLLMMQQAGRVGLLGGDGW
jgi:hypothetical protein